MLLIPVLHHITLVQEVSLLALLMKAQSAVELIKRKNYLRKATQRPLAHRMLSQLQHQLLQIKPKWLKKNWKNQLKYLNSILKHLQMCKLTSRHPNKVKLQLKSPWSGIKKQSRRRKWNIFCFQIAFNTKTRSDKHRTGWTRLQKGRLTHQILILMTKQRLIYFQ